ncbi:MAG: dihydrodipicolinate synthase family protein, partial [Pseudomonadota bacterium]
MVEISIGREPRWARSRPTSKRWRPHWRRWSAWQYAYGRIDYIKPPQRGLVERFTAVADACDLPMILYNVPGRTGVDMHVDTVAELAKHPRIIDIKQATGDVARVPVLRDLCGDDSLLVSGDDATSLDFVAAGGDGVISVTTNIAPRQMQQTMTLGKTDLAAAREID